MVLEFFGGKVEIRADVFGMATVLLRTWQEPCAESILAGVLLGLGICSFPFLSIWSSLSILKANI